MGCCYSCCCTSTTTAEHGYDHWSEFGSPAPPPVFTSKVVGPGRELSANEWQNIGLLVPHEALRYEFTLFGWMLSHPNFDAADARKADALLDFWNSAPFPLIVGHHNGEDSDAVVKVFPDVYGEGKRATLEHVGLHQMAEEVDSRCRQMARCAHDGDASGAAQHKAELDALFTRLEAEMVEHLAEEERAFPVAVRKTEFGSDPDSSRLDKHYFKRMMSAEVNAMAKRFGGKRAVHTRLMPVALVVIVSTINAWGGREEADKFMSQLPPPVRAIVYRGMGKPAFRRLVELLKVVDAPKRGAAEVELRVAKG